MAEKMKSLNEEMNTKEQNKDITNDISLYDLPKDEADKYEKKYENELLEKFIKMHEIFTDEMSKLNGNADFLGIDELNFQDVAVTVNNKVWELFTKFKRSGIDYPVESSTITAIYRHFRKKLDEQSRVMNEMVEELRQVAEEINEDIEHYTRSLSFKIRRRIMSWLGLEYKFYYDNNERIQKYLQKFKEIDDDVYNFEIDKNNIQSIIKEDIDHRIKNAFPFQNDNKNQISAEHRAQMAMTSFYLIDKEYSEDLKKLGFDGIVDEMKSEIEKEYCVRIVYEDQDDSEKKLNENSSSKDTNGNGVNKEANCSADDRVSNENINQKSDGKVEKIEQR